MGRRGCRILTEAEAKQPQYFPSGMGTTEWCLRPQGDGDVMTEAGNPGRIDA